MIRVHVLVEGQTEEAFVNELLGPHYAGAEIYLRPTVISTSPGHKGGVVSYAKVKPQIQRRCKEDPRAFVTTLFDLYRLPNDFPGKDSTAYAAAPNGHAKAVWLEQEMQRDVALHNFIPNLLVHEFEALLFSNVDAFVVWTDGPESVLPLRELLQQAPPEDINDGFDTAPSKRIVRVIPGYHKVVHGPLIAGDIGLDSIRSACPHFDQWLQKIEALS